MSERDPKVIKIETLLDRLGNLAVESFHYIALFIIGCMVAWSAVHTVIEILTVKQYATIDALSNGRAEIMAGRGSFTESFPLFGYDLANYEELFDEKLDMLLKIKENTNLTWQGKHAQTVANKPVYPRAVQEDFPIWVATGGDCVIIMTGA